MRGKIMSCGIRAFAVLTILAGTRMASAISGPDTQLAYLAAGDRVLIINTVTGEQEVVSGPSKGTGPLFSPGLSGYRVTDCMIEDSTNLIVCSSRFFFRVNRTTGDRTVLNVTPVVDGQESNFDIVTTFIPDSSGYVLAFITGMNPSRITRINLSTMTGAVVSNSTTGTGPGFSAYASCDIYKEQGGTLLVQDFTNQQVLRVDPVTGNRTKLNPGTQTFYSLSAAPLSSTEMLLGGMGAGDILTRFNHNTGVYTNIPVTNSSFYASSLITYDDGSVVAYTYDMGGQLLRTPSLTPPVTFTSVVVSGPPLPTGNYNDPNSLRPLSTNVISEVPDWTNY